MDLTTMPTFSNLEYKEEQIDVTNSRDEEMWTQLRKSIECIDQGCQINEMPHPFEAIEVNGSSDMSSTEPTK
jgi:hypothetical protein